MAKERGIPGWPSYQVPLGTKRKRYKLLRELEAMLSHQIPKTRFKLVGDIFVEQGMIVGARLFSLWERYKIGFDKVYIDNARDTPMGVSYKGAGPSFYAELRIRPFARTYSSWHAIASSCSRSFWDATCWGGIQYTTEFNSFSGMVDHEIGHLLTVEGIEYLFGREAPHEYDFRRIHGYHTQCDLYEALANVWVRHERGGWVPGPIRRIFNQYSRVQISEDTY